MSFHWKNTVFYPSCSTVCIFVGIILLNGDTNGVIVALTCGRFSPGSFVWMYWILIVHVLVTAWGRRGSSGENLLDSTPWQSGTRQILGLLSTDNRYSTGLGNKHTSTTDSADRHPHTSTHVYLIDQFQKNYHTWYTLPKFHTCTCTNSRLLATFSTTTVNNIWKHSEKTMGVEKYSTPKFYDGLLSTDNNKINQLFNFHNDYLH